MGKVMIMIMIMVATTVTATSMGIVFDHQHKDHASYRPGAVVRR